MSDSSYDKAKKEGAVANIVDHLAQTVPAWSGAQRVLFTGCSAGAFGVYANAEWLADHVPAGAVVMAAASSGTGETYLSVDATWAEFQQGATHALPDMSLVHLASLYDVVLPATCAAAQGTDAERKLCALGAFSAPYTNGKVPIFHLVSQYDENWIGVGKDQRGAEEAQAYIAHVGDAVRAAHEALPGAIFSASCYNHCTGLTVRSGAESLVRVDGRHAQELLADWFFDRNELPHRVIEARYGDGLPGGNCGSWGRRLLPGEEEEEMVEAGW